jgi:hypothetical protein
MRTQTDKLVYELEMWVTAVEGGKAMPPRGDTTSAGLRRRLDTVAQR